MPSSKNQIKKEISKLCDFPYSIIFLVSSKKINKTIIFFKEFFSDRKIMIAKEMTKIYENFIREDISKLNLLKYIVDE